MSKGAWLNFWNIAVKSAVERHLTEPRQLWCTN